MEFDEAVRGRRMVRSFSRDPIDADVVRHLCDLAQRAPSAGNSQGTALLVLDDRSAVDRYWDRCLPESRRASFRWPGLLAAPVLMIVAVRAATYVERYGEPDKASTGLGAGSDAWTVPYWWVDAGAAIENVLLGAVDVGLGACFFGLFDNEQRVIDEFGVPDGWRLVGTVALGHPTGEDRPGRSSGRVRLALDQAIHRNAW